MAPVVFVPGGEMKVRCCDEHAMSGLEWCEGGASRLERFHRSRLAQNSEAHSASMVPSTRHPAIGHDPLGQCRPVVLRK
jgi:hypothetical protein